MHSQYSICIVARCRNCSVVIVRLIFVCCGLLFAGVVFAEGTYQQTKNGKITVWNDDAKPGDTATWNGGHDSDRYARGFGTLSWYNRDSGVYARYFGNMVRGKFDGSVNVHSNGKTQHAIFVDGKRTSRWARGPAPSRIAAAKKTETRGQQIARAENPPKEREHNKENAQRSEPDRHLTLNPPKDGSAVADAQRPITEAPAEGPVVAKTEMENIESNRLTSRDTQTTPSPPRPVSTATSSQLRNDSRPDNQPPGTPSQKPTGARQETEVKATPEKSVSKSTTDNKPNGANDDSVRSLVRPPSSLRVPSASDVSSDGSTLPSTTTPGPDTGLSLEELIKAGDAEARKAGYNLDEYFPPRTQHDVVDDIWWIIYEHKPGSRVATTAKNFNVAVDGKTKKTMLVRDD